MNPVPTQRAIASRLFNHTKLLFASLGVCLLFVTSFQSQAAPLPFFSDPAMQQCLDEQVLANGWVNAEDVTVFNCVDRGVQSIQGIQVFVNLRELDLSNNNITDVLALYGFYELTTLYLSGNSGIDYFQLQSIISQNGGLTRMALT